MKNKGKLLIDGECDTNLVGNGFIVESQSNRSVDVHGFIDSTKFERLPFVLAITTLDLEDEVILLELKECIIVKNDKVPPKQEKLVSL